MTDLRASDALSTGEVLANRYELQERIGEGGMARVYRAYDLHLQRSVAVKVFRDTADGIGSVERALSETTLLASVTHHALVTVFDAHVSPDDACYFVMEHVDGITLSDLIAEGPVDPDVVAAITVDLAEGLHSAHAAGIVHRDIKPSNVLLERSLLPGRTWHAKLADFGIAYLRDSTRVTTPGLLVGTAAYVAPEQARGAAPAPAADIYSFGILLLEALTGRRPFADAEGIGTVVARLMAPPEIPDTLPEAWRGLLRGMTALQPDDRPTALEVATTAARILSPQQGAIASVVDLATAPITVTETPTLAYPAPPVPGATPGGTTDAGATTVHHVIPPSGDPRRRRRIGAGIIGVIVLLGTLLGAIWMSTVPTGVADPTPSAPATPVIQEQQTPTPAPEAPPPSAPAVDDGGGNDNSGPGNNKGNGNGNGPGSNSGNGNGGGQGNGNR